MQDEELRKLEVALAEIAHNGRTTGNNNGFVELSDMDRIYVGRLDALSMFYDNLRDNALIPNLCADDYNNTAEALTALRQALEQSLTGRARRKYLARLDKVHRPTLARFGTIDWLRSETTMTDEAEEAIAELRRICALLNYDAAAVDIVSLLAVDGGELQALRAQYDRKAQAIANWRPDANAATDDDTTDTTEAVNELAQPVDQPDPQPQEAAAPVVNDIPWRVPFGVPLALVPGDFLTNDDLQNFWDPFFYNNIGTELQPAAPAAAATEQNDGVPRAPRLVNNPFEIADRLDKLINGDRRRVLALPVTADQNKNAVAKFTNLVGDRYSNNIRAKLRQDERTVTQLSEQLNKQRVLLEQLTAANRRGEMVERILRDGFWSLPIYDTTSDLLWFRTSLPVVVEERNLLAGIENYYNVGYLAVRLDAGLGAYVYPAGGGTRDSQVKHLYHPHIQVDGQICFGDAAARYKEASASGDLVGVLSAVQDAITGYNPHSAYEPITSFTRYSQTLPHRTPYAPDRKNLMEALVVLG